mgnify:CR=1 FL=1
MRVIGWAKQTGLPKVRQKLMARHWDLPMDWYWG